MGSKSSKPAKSAEAGDAAPKTSSSSSKASSASGAYLVFSPETGGILTLVWADAPPAGVVLAFFSPKKTVPEHKKTLHAGRMELIRNCSSDKKKMYEGFTHFVKEGYAYDSDLKQISNQYFDVWYCSSNQVYAIKVNEMVNTKKFDALAVVPHQNTSFNGVKKTDMAQFVNLATREGAVWKH